MKSALEKSDNTSSEFPAGMRVLIVDGNPESLHLLETMLKQCDYEGIYMLWSLVPFFISPLFFLFGCEENNGITNNNIRDPCHYLALSLSLMCATLPPTLFRFLNHTPCCGVVFGIEL